MGDVRGMLTRERLGELIEGGDIETVLVAFPDLYGRPLGKRFDAGFFIDEVADSGTHACDYLLTVDMEMEPVAGYAFAGWEQGYGDVHLAPELETLRRAAWLDRTALVLCDVHEPSHRAAAVAPRTMLRRQVERARDAGYTVRAGSELEYYIFRRSYRDAAAGGYSNLEPAGWYIEDDARGGTQRRRAPSPPRLRRSGRGLQGGVGRRSARVERAPRRGAGDGRPPRDLQRSTSSA